MIDVVIFVTEEPGRVHPRVSVAPCDHRPLAQAAAELGGSWDGGSWTFEQASAADVEAACRAAYGSANPTSQDIDNLYAEVDIVSARIMAESARYLDPPLSESPGGTGTGTAKSPKSPHELLRGSFVRLGKACAPYRRDRASAPAGLFELWEAASQLGNAKPRATYKRATRPSAGTEGWHAGLHQLFMTARRLEEAQSALAKVTAATPA